MEQIMVEELETIEDAVLRQTKMFFHSERQDIHALYHSYSMKMIFLNKEGYTIFELFKNSKRIKNVLYEYQNSLDRKDQKIFLEHLSDTIEIIRQLSKGGFLLKEEFDESIFLKEIQEESVFEPRIDGMYILPTLACNFSCKYCDIIQGDLRKDHHRRMEKMSKETMKKGIDLFINNVSKTRDIKKWIIFYGGEPLLYPDLVKFGVEYLRKEEILFAFGKRGVDISLLTNGSLIEDDMIKFFKDFNVGVGISLDGREADNDKMRQYPDGKGTFKDAVRGLKILQKHSLNPGISFTIGTHNLNELEENTRFLVEELGVKSVNYNILNEIEVAKNPAFVEAKLAIDKIINVSHYLEEKDSYEDRIARRWPSFIEKNYYFNDCAGCGGQIVLLPDRHIGPCHVFSGSKRYFIPLKEDIDFRNEPIWKEWARRSPFNTPQCYNCNLISICGGGCPYRGYCRKGSIWEIDEDMCRDSVSKILELYIWKAYEKRKEIFEDTLNEKEAYKKKLFPIPVLKWV
jgi:uncharacterized protein